MRNPTAVRMSATVWLSTTVWISAVMAGLFVAAAPAAAAPQAVIGGDWRNDVEDFARQVVEAGLTPGIGLAVAGGDWVLWTAAVGSADLSAGRAVTPRTPFYIASSTKSLTATAAALAAHEGRLDLDAPMIRYLPDARLPEGVEPELITVRDLLTLTHGLSGSGPVVMRTAFTGEFTRAGLLDLLRHHLPTGEQGSFDYNNLGYNLLGMVLEEVYGVGWKEVVDQLVLEPLGMRSTTAYVSDLGPDRMAQPHALGPDGWVRVPLAKTDANLHAAGGHFATPTDLARYLAAHMSGGQIDGETLLPATPLNETHRLHVRQDREFGPYHRFGWGYGWDLGTYAGDTLVHRFGGFAGYRSHMSFMPAHGIGVVVLVNGSGPASPAADLVATFAYDRLLGKPGLAERYAARLDSLSAAAERYREGVAEHRAERARRLSPLSRPLGMYAGTYESPVLGTMKWRVVGGGLEMRIGVLSSRAEVYDAAADQLRVELAGSGRVVDFEFGRGGPAHSATLAGVEFRRAGDPD